MNKFIISVVGEDRPGIIATLTKTLFQLDCNIENVSQTILQSQFSGTFIVSVPEKISKSDLTQQISAGIHPLNLQAIVKEIGLLSSYTAPATAEPFVITTIGPDRKGLVAGITEIIARYDANVTNLQAIFKGGDDPEGNIMIYEVDVPVDTDRQTFHKDLRKRAEELNLNISIQHRNIFEAINRI